MANAQGQIHRRPALLTHESLGFANLLLVNLFPPPRTGDMARVWCGGKEGEHVRERLFFLIGRLLDRASELPAAVLHESQLLRKLCLHIQPKHVLLLLSNSKRSRRSECVCYEAKMGHL